MKARLFLVVAVLGWLAAPARAHRLDEFLQATTISLEKDGLVLQLRLTPGVAVAAPVLASLDANGDGTLSDAEQQAYAERVRRDLSLAIDDRAVPLRLVSATFPTAEAITGGVGDIRLTFAADLPTGGAPTHRLTFENHHQRAVAVYLVNCLVPRDPSLRVVAQDRSEDQARYQLDFTAGNPPPSAPATLALANVRSQPPPAGPPASKSFFPRGTQPLFLGTLLLVLGAAILRRKRPHSPAQPEA